MQLSAATQLPTKWLKLGIKLEGTLMRADGYHVHLVSPETNLQVKLLRGKLSKYT
jgi:hypothetical protein